MRKAHALGNRRRRHQHGYRSGDVQRHWACRFLYDESQIINENIIRNLERAPCPSEAFKRTRKHPVPIVGNLVAHVDRQMVGIWEYLELRPISCSAWSGLRRQEGELMYENTVLWAKDPW